MTNFVDVLRLALDTDAMARRRDGFLQAFYDHYMAWLVEPS